MYKIVREKRKEKKRKERKKVMMYSV